MLFDKIHVLLVENYARVVLPHDIPPNEGVRLQFSLPAIRRPGDYVVELDMVDEGFLWFKDYAYLPKSWFLTVYGEEVAGEGDKLIASDGIEPVLIAPAELSFTPRPALSRIKHLMRRSWQVLRWRGPVALFRSVVDYLSKRLVTH